MRISDWSSDVCSSDLTVANLMTMPHRSHEWPQTLKQLRIAFASSAFAVHGPVPVPFGDEGAANHMRLCSSHDEAGVEVFVHGKSGGPFRSEEHTSELPSLMRTSYAVFCLKKKNQ